MFKVSLPTKAQLIIDLQRAVAVFVVAAFGFWQLSNFAFNKAALHGLVLAGAMAVFGLVKSTATTLL